jgi:hypothetical protein
MHFLVGRSHEVLGKELVTSLYKEEVSPPPRSSFLSFFFFFLLFYHLFYYLFIYYLFSFCILTPLQIFDELLREADGVVSRRIAASIRLEALKKAKKVLQITELKDMPLQYY